tara:strand:- start:5676 stop:6128 length:453 start_codon:yes stop_codon:yes gene_type:complete
MKITKAEALQKLAANPQAAKEYDEATAVQYPGMSREQAVELTVQALNLKRDKSAKLAELKKETAEIKAKLATTQAKLASLVKTRDAIKAASLKTSTLNPSMKSTPIKPAPQLITAVEFASPIIEMSRAEFAKLSPSDKSRFVKQGHKISN